METEFLHLVLVDDDPDECEIFQAALQQVTTQVKLTILNQCEELLKWLHENPHQLPDLLFVDFQMPAANGLECLKKIKQNPRFHFLPVIILSITVSDTTLRELYQNGALYFIQKPTGFQQQIQLIEQVLRLPEEKRTKQPRQEEFILNVR